jgi:hypothetical protein
MYRLTAPPTGSTIAASSGPRLVLQRAGGQVVNFVSDAATFKMALGPDLAVSPPSTPLAQPHFGQGPDGTVFSAGPINADPPADCNCTSHQRFDWVFTNAGATSVEVNESVDPEVYASGQVVGGLCHQCNPGYVTLPSFAAWIDAKSVLVAAPASDPDRTLTATRLLTRDPITAPAKRRTKTAATDVPPGNLASDRVGLVTSAGFGYQILADSNGNQVALSIFDPGCDAN